MDGAALSPERARDPGVVGFVRRYIWWIGGIGGLLFVTVMRPFLIHRPDPPEVIAQVPAEFALLDQDGTEFSPESMRGRVWVVGFMFTRCPSLCPQITAAMARFHDSLDRAGLTEAVHLLSVTVDPEQDSPERLRDYARAHGADVGSWRFVTAGTVDATERFVVDGFRVAVGERSTLQPGVYDIAHSSKLALVDRQGGVRGFYSIDEDGLEELFHRALAVTRLEDP